MAAASTSAPAHAPAPMSWSWRVGRIRGIAIYVHFTTVLLVAWVALAQRPEGFGAIAGGLLALAAIFAVVLLHELGHAFAARALGVRTRDITLLPMGGVSRMERGALVPWKELVIALAGPSVNVGIALLAWSAMRVSPSALKPILQQLIWLDAWLAAFNLLPASPMDGGHALRAALAMRMGRVRATEVAAGLGLALAVLLAGVGLMFDPVLAVVALFVGIGANGELARLAMEKRLAGKTIRDVMLARFDTVRADEALGDVSRRTFAGAQQHFPVLSRDGSPVGVITGAQVRQGVRALGEGAPVSAAMQPRFTTVDPNERLDAAWDLVDEEDTAWLVMREGRLVGLVTAASIADGLRADVAHAA